MNAFVLKFKLPLGNFDLKVLDGLCRGYYLIRLIIRITK